MYTQTPSTPSINLPLFPSQNTGSIACEQCPEGYACPFTFSNFRIQCPGGTYSEGEQTACTECPAGYYCPSTVEDLEIECPDGTFSVGNETSCTVCPVGYECPDKDFDSR